MTMVVSVRMECVMEKEHVVRMQEKSLATDVIKLVRVHVKPKLESLERLIMPTMIVREYLHVRSIRV